MAAGGSNKLLPTARWKGHREVVEQEDGSGGGSRMSKV